MSAGASIPAGLTRQSEVTGDLHIECGVVIVGSGAGGATMAAELADAGIDVVMVEEGGYHPTESFTAEAGRALRTLYRDGGAGLAFGKPPVLFSQGRCVGGSTVVNGGMSWRTPPHVLDRWARDEDLAAIGERDMEPYFAKVESRISVGYQDAEHERQIVRLAAEQAKPALVAEAVALTRATRDHPDLRFGASVRGAIDYARLVPELADIRAVPADDWQAGLDAALTTLSGRVRLHESCRRSADQVIEEIFGRIRAQAADSAGGEPGPGE